jgi:hypothetical protein
VSVRRIIKVKGRQESLAGGTTYLAYFKIADNNHEATKVETIEKSSCSSWLRGEILKA